MPHLTLPTAPARLLPAMALALLLAACGGGGGDDEARTAFIDGATASSGGEMTEAQAGCIYDEVAQELDASQLEDFDFSSEPEDPEVAEAVFTAVEACLDA